MKKNIFPFLIIMIGLTYYLGIKTSNTISEKTYKTEYKITYDEIKSIDTGYVFLDIFLNNLIVGVILSLFGFLSGGLITIIVLFWNGYILGIVYDLSFRILEFGDILYFSKHIPLEIIALILFSQIGFRGFSFYKKVLLNKKIDIEIAPKIKEFIIPTLLLFISSAIEIS